MPWMVSISPVSLRSTKARLQPSRANTCATLRPIPDAAPVTIATLSFSLMAVVSPHERSGCLSSRSGVVLPGAVRNSLLSALRAPSRCRFARCDGLAKMRDDILSEQLDRVQGFFVRDRPELHHGQELIELGHLL